MSRSEFTENLKDRFPVLENLTERLPAGGFWLGLGGAILVLFVIWYPVGMMITHKIDDDIEWQAPANLQPEGGSKAVAATAGLILREVQDNDWVANSPFFYPSSALDNMPNFQKGLVAALGRFAFELTDQLGRRRGSSQADADLQDAAGALQYAADIWYFDLSTSIAPTPTAEEQYAKAARDLIKYNERLGKGDAVFDRRSDNLLATLDRIAIDLGSSSANIDEHVTDQSDSWVDLEADDVFYSVKGQTYAYYIVLKELGQDFDQVIKDRGLEEMWPEMMDTLRLTAELQPFVVSNGEPDAQFLPNHLAAQGFYLLRARTQMREITNILLK